MGLANLMKLFAELGVIQLQQLLPNTIFHLDSN